MKRLSRLLAIVTLAAFSVQALGLVNVAAAQTGGAPVPGFVQTAQGLAGAMGKVQALLLAIQGKAARGKDASVELQQLQLQAQTLQALLGQLQGQLGTTAQRLQALVQQGKVSGEVLTQFQTFQSTWQNATTATLTALSALETPSPLTLGQRAATALGTLQALRGEQPLTIHPRSARSRQAAPPAVRHPPPGARGSAGHHPRPGTSRA